MLEQNNHNRLGADKRRGGDKPTPQRWRGRPHQQRHDPPARTYRSAVVDPSDHMLCHMIGIARAMVRRNIATKASVQLPASR